MLAWPLFHERSATPTDAMLASWCEVLPHFFAPPGQKTVLGIFSSSTRLRSFATTSSYLLAILEIAGCHAATFQQSLWSTVSSGSLDKMFRSSHDLAAATADFFTTTGLHAAAALAQSVCCTLKDLAALFCFSRSALPSTVHSTDEAAFSILSDSAEDDPIQSFTHHG